MTASSSSSAEQAYSRSRTPPGSRMCMRQAVSCSCQVLLDRLLPLRVTGTAQTSEGHHTAGHLTAGRATVGSSGLSPSPSGRLLVHEAQAKKAPPLSAVVLRDLWSRGNTRQPLASSSLTTHPSDVGYGCSRERRRQVKPFCCRRPGELMQLQKAHARRCDPARRTATGHRRGRPRRAQSSRLPLHGPVNPDRPAHCGDISVYGQRSDAVPGAEECPLCFFQIALSGAIQQGLGGQSSHSKTCGSPMWVPARAERHLG